MTYAAAARAAAALGLHIASAGDTAPPPPAAPPPVVASISPTGVKLDANGQAIAFPVAPPPAAAPSGIVTAQKPESGYRVTKGDTIHLTLNHAASN
jgi:hypothetical protein